MLVIVNYQLQLVNYNYVCQLQLTVIDIGYLQLNYMLEL